MGMLRKFPLVLLALALAFSLFQARPALAAGGQVSGVIWLEKTVDGEMASGEGGLEGAKPYVTLFPCNECAKAIIQAGIRTVVYDSDKYALTPSTIASKRMFDAAGVRYYRYTHTGRTISFEL